MALIIKDRVKEITTTTGTGAVSLGGASATFDAFQSVMSNGDTTFYAIVHTASGTDEWEVGLGTWNTGNTLTRTTVYAGSNGTSAVNFSSGNKDIFMTYPASKAAVAGEDVTFADVTATDITSTGTVTLSADPSSSLQAATKQYVDTIAAAGIHYHTPVRVEHPSNLNATYNNGSSGVGATLTNAGTNAALVLDNVNMALNDRVLVANQTDQTQNGVYTVTTVGDGSTAWVLTRSTDTDTAGPSDPDAFGKGDAFFIKEGDTNAGHLDVLTTTGTIVFGTTNIVFSEVAETSIYSAGTGLTLTGTTFSTNQDISTSASPTFAGGTFTGNVDLGDDDYIRLGDSQDLQIYHNASHSVIKDAGTGNLNLLADNFRIANAGWSKWYFIANNGGAATVFWNGQARLATSSGGIDVTGNITVSGSVDGRDVATDGTKLDGIETGATGDQTASEILTAIKTVDGAGSNLDADLLDGQQGSYYLNTSTTFSGDVSGTYGAMVVADDSHNHVISNVDGLQTALDGKTTTSRTITAGDGLTGGGDFTANRTINVGAGSGITVTADAVSHADTSSQASVNNSNGTVIQDVTLDTYGHVTGLTSANLDGRYYTETEADSRFVNVTGDTMTGGLTISSGSDLVLSTSGTDIGDIVWSDSSGEKHRLWDGGTGLNYRYRAGTSYLVFHDGYHPNADKWTTARTLSLSGDASGSVSWDGSANATLSVTVANDSHSHSNYITSNANDTSTGTIAFGTGTLDPDSYTSYSGGFGNIADGGGWSARGVFVSGGTGKAAAMSSGSGNVYFGTQDGTNANSMSTWLIVPQSTKVASFTNTPTVSGSTMWHAGNDGSGSGLDADLLDGVQGSSYLRSDATDTFTNLSGTSLTLGSGVTLQESTDRADLLQITSSTSGWGGLQIRNSSNEGRWSFMTDGEAAGIYNDEDEHWAIYMNESAGVDLRYNGSIKFNTTSYGAVVKGDGGETLTLQDTGDTHYTATAYLYFNDSAGTMMGYLGKSTYGSYDMTLHAASGGDIVLFTSGGLKYYNGSTEYNIWHAANDGSGSGLDADLWDGNQFSSYLNQAVLSTSSPSFAGLNINGNLNAVDNVYVAGNVYHEGDTDTYIEFNVNQISLVTGGSSEVTIDPTGVRLGDSGNAYVQPVSGNYGSFQIDGGAHGGWEGYSIGGQWVFMSNGADAGIYNDIDNEWMAYFTRNGSSYLYYNGSSKLSTNNTGISVTGTVAATSYTGDGSSLTGISAGASGGGSDEIFWENDQTITSKYTNTKGKNAMTAGPVKLNSGVTVNIGDGEAWTVV